MPPEMWRCLEVYADSFEQRNILVQDIVDLMRRLKEQAHIDSYFFNRYSNPSDNIYFVKLGYINGDEIVEFELRGLLENHVAVTKIRPYECEMWEVDNVAVDRIKCISCELHEKVRDGFGERITIKQAFYLLHFLMNQLGYSYNEEHRLYRMLEENIGRQLGGTS